jgi:hypothetical protein
LEYGSHPLGHEPCRQEFIHHHLWWDYLAFRLICTKKGEKVGAKRGKSGRAGTRTQDLTDVNPKIQDRVRDVILLEVESFNN